ncbi:hypothetical protein [Pontibacter arcticus]|nr:hypothetical protein [Pontibacter arcticus]
MKADVLEIKLLPYSYKKIGYWLLALAIPVMFGIGLFILALDASFNLIADETAFWGEWNYPLVYYPLIIALRS